MDDSKSIKWYIDAAFGVHKDLKSHTGAIISLGKGIVSSVSTKKVNSRSSTEEEFIAVDEIIRRSIVLTKSVDNIFDYHPALWSYRPAMFFNC
jgi:hypothetical protein